MGAADRHHQPRRRSIVRLAFALTGALVASLAVASCAQPGTPVVEVRPTTDPATAGPGGTTLVAPTVGPLPATGPVEANAVVEHVVDGDTIDVRLQSSSGRRERVRLIGIDTPESKKPNTPVECFALEASAGTARLLPVGTPVRLDQDVEARDRYGRLLAYVHRASDGLFVNLELARAGYASVLTYPPNVAHVDDFVSAVAAARAARVGLWGRCESGHEPA